jgi:hypothetical protein
VPVKREKIGQRPDGKAISQEVSKKMTDADMELAASVLKGCRTLCMQSLANEIAPTLQKY